MVIGSVKYPESIRGLEANYLRVLLLLLCLAASASGVFAEPSGERWTNIPYTLGSATLQNLQDYAVDVEERPWAIFGHPTGLYYLQDREWRRMERGIRIISLSAANRTSPADAYLLHGQSRFFRTSGGKLYLSVCQASDQNIGAIFEVDVKGCRYVARFLFAESANPFPLSLDSNGRFWNWTAGKLSVFENGSWTSTPASFDMHRRMIPFAESAGGDLFFAGTKSIMQIPAGDVKRAQEIPWINDSAKIFQLAALGNDRLIVQYEGTPKPRIFHLREKRDESELPRYEALSKRTISQLIPDGKGNVYLFAGAGWGFLLEGGNQPVQEYPNSIPFVFSLLNYSFGPDGTLWLFTFSPSNTLGYLRGETIKVTGFKEEGLDLANVKSLHGRADGKVWIASRDNGLYLFNPNSVGEKPDFPWIEYPLAVPALLRGFHADIWCVLKEKPDFMSRWDGQKWEHRPTGNKMRLTPLSIDDLGRLHAVASDSPTNYVRLDSSGLKIFGDIHPMLEDAVKSGAKRFRMASPESPPLILPGNHIWWSPRSSGSVYYYDGSRWQVFPCSSGMRSIYLWKQREVRAMDDNLNVYGLHDGKWAKVDKASWEPGFIQPFLVGENGLQVFAMEDYKASNSQLRLIRWWQQDAYRYDNSKLNGTFIYYNYEDPNQEPVPSKASRIGFGYDTRIAPVSDGFFFREGDMSTRRYYEALRLAVPLRMLPWGPSPFPWNVYHDIYEDNAGNLWFRGASNAYMVPKRQIETKLGRSGPGKEIRVGATLNGRSAKDLLYYWRVNGGEWSQPAKEPLISVPVSGCLEATAADEFGFVDRTPAVAQLP